MQARSESRLPIGILWAAVAGLVVLSGCSVGATHWPTDEEMAAFEAAGPVDPELSEDQRAQLLPGLPHSGPYRLAVGDIVSVSPGDVFASTVAAGSSGFGGPSAGRPTDVEARVHPDGQCTLPLIGAIDTVGKTLPELEDDIVAGLSSLFKNEPSIVVRVAEKATHKVAVMGAVEEPGVRELTSDQLTLIGALSESGGILKASNLKVGAKRIRIRRPGESASDPIALTVRGLNIPEGDVALTGGETIEVERWDPDIFTVIGLVTKPGAYEYPPNREYNLMDALAVAGGTDRIADPPYATVFRKDELGNVLAVTFPLEADDLVRSSLVPIRPGDVISVQHTAGSWTRSLIAQIVRLQLNFFVDPIRN